MLTEWGVNISEELLTSSVQYGLMHVFVNCKKEGFSFGHITWHQPSYLFSGTKIEVYKLDLIIEKGKDGNLTVKVHSVLEEPSLIFKIKISKTIDKLDREIISTEYYLHPKLTTTRTAEFYDFMRMLLQDYNKTVIY